MNWHDGKLVGSKIRAKTVETRISAVLSQLSMQGWILTFGGLQTLAQAKIKHFLHAADVIAFVFR